MLGEQLIRIGGARLVAALAAALIAVTLLLVVSVTLNVRQHSNAATAATAAAAALSAAEAKARSDLAACGDTNAREVATARALGAELLACRGTQQRIDEALALARRQRDRARREADGQAQMRREAIEAIARTDESCNRPLCRALSEQLLSDPTGEAAHQH